jgi:hypothetical protein
LAGIVEGCACVCEVEVTASAAIGRRKNANARATVEKPFIAELLSGTESVMTCAAMPDVGIRFFGEDICM